jgi:glutamine phosphoribosylpyrophosphate amidotransferase
MCAIIGAFIQNPSLEDFESLKRVFLESRIRGMHATGISFLPSWSDKVITIKDAIPADEFVSIHMHNDNMKEMINADGNLYLIGHCRYSTSDLLYNQPIANDEHSIVHNGVITQELPENWDKIFQYKCETKNDSELVLHSASPLEEFPDASMAVCELTNDKKILFYRNGKRPLWLSQIENGYIITSTADIPRRAGFETLTSEITKDTYCTIHSDGAIMFEKVETNTKDLQNV